MRILPQPAARKLRMRACRHPPRFAMALARPDAELVQVLWGACRVVARVGVPPVRRVAGVAAGARHIRYRLDERLEHPESW